MPSALEGLTIMLIFYNFIWIKNCIITSWIAWFSIFVHMMWYRKLVRRILWNWLCRSWLLLGISFVCLNKIWVSRPKRLFTAKNGYLLESWIWSSARFDSRAAQSTRCWARIPKNYFIGPRIEPRSFRNRKNRKLFTWDIGLVICFLDSKELISFFFDISHDFLQFFDEFIQSDVNLVIGLSPFVFNFFQPKILFDFSLGFGAEYLRDNHLVPTSVDFAI